MKVVFVDNFSINFGLMYVATVAQKAGHEIKLLLYPLSKWHDTDQYQFPEKYYSFEKIALEILAEKPDVVCCSVFSPNFMFFKHLAAVLRQKSRVPVVVGGVLPSLRPDLFLENTDCDFVFRGEAELAIADLLESIYSKKNIHSIPNIVYRNEGGAIIENPLSSFVRDLDTLPFYNKRLYPNQSKQLFMLSSRGCPLTCSYCSAGMFSRITAGGEKVIRKRTVDAVIAEIKEALKEVSYKEVFFFDDWFIGSVPWLTEFSEKYAKEIALPYYCLAFPSTINERVASLLAKSGCKSVEMGFQIANEKYKETVLKRKESKIAVANAITTLRENGIKVTIDQIFGFPGETKSHIEESLDFFTENRIKSLAIFFLNYYPDSLLSNFAYKNGYLSKEQFDKVLRNEMVGEQSYKGTILNENLAVEKVQLAVLFRFASWLPRRFVKWLLHSNAYCFFPSNRYFYYFVSMVTEMKNRGVRFILMTAFLAFGFRRGKMCVKPDGVATAAN